VIKLIETERRKAVAIPGDLKSESFCQELVAKANLDLGGLDLLVNVAGRQKSVESIAATRQRCR
jgi:NAD(P)-dependent dehydrogenase (short-subunit alcohol dehydrogenase family)